MCAVFPDDFNPEFAAVDPAVAAYWIKAATGAIDVKKWTCAGVDYCEGIQLKASHLMKEAGLGTGPAVPAGAIVSESRGGKSVSRATSSAATGPHGSTVYGQALDNLLARVNGTRRRHMPPAPQPAC